MVKTRTWLRLVERTRKRGYGKLCSLIFVTVLFLSAHPRSLLSALQAAPTHTQTVSDQASASKTSATKPDGKITLENVLGSSEINFQLNNSISPQRYSIETM